MIFFSRLVFTDIVRLSRKKNSFAVYFCFIVWLATLLYCMHGAFESWWFAQIGCLRLSIAHNIIDVHTVCCTS